MARLQDKVAIVTGAGSGMGKQMALLFAREGAKVVCADRSGAEAQTAAAIGAAAVAVHVDVSISVDIQNMIRTAEERFGRLDVLVNNDGLGGKMMALHEQSEDRYAKTQCDTLKSM